MAANSNISREDILASRQMLKPVPESRRLGGFANMLDKEMGEWFRTRRWLTSAIVWLAIINGMITFVLFVAPAVDPKALVGENGQPIGKEEIAVMGLTLFFSIGIIAGSIGMIIMAQDEIIREKQSGTAAWILSKPVSRSSFILTKLLASLVGALIFIVGLPAVAAYIQVYLASGVAIPVLKYLAAAGVMYLTLLFYLALVVMLGVLFEQRGRVLGIAFGLMFGGLILVSFLPALGYVLPLSMDKIALAIAMGQAVPAAGVAEITSTAVLSILFAAVAVWRFRQLEF
jgi:ABC-2 type transport system permease protein